LQHQKATIAQLSPFVFILRCKDTETFPKLARKSEKISLVRPRTAQN
jgi:hypothetical protein